ncbi:MAG: 3-hydroxylacyl-ACP dehydratase [Algicola sp.]|nr:3-hydroxylacyl-ACP dehydratase [Algicola sp.]
MNSYSIEQVLPHRQPMILIDSLCQYDDESAICSVKITESSLFYDSSQQAVPSYIGVEYMAQAIAALAGADALDANLEVEIGYLLGSRKYQPTTAWFALGSDLNIHVSRLYEEDSGLRVFQCQIKHNSENLVDAKINVFLPQRAAQQAQSNDVEIKP